MKIIKIQDYRNMGFVAREDGIDGYLTNNDEVLSGGSIFTQYTGGRYVITNGSTGYVKMGPFLDDTDGDTEEEALSIAYTDVFLSKNDGDMATKSETSSASHNTRGWYNVVLDATDTGTGGKLLVSIQVAGALPVWRMFEVLFPAP